VPTSAQKHSVEGEDSKSYGMVLQVPFDSDFKVIVFLLSE